MLTSVFAMAQQAFVVTGRVTDENSAAVPGATVLLAGSSQGTVTDAEGRYSLTVEPGVVLKFSCLGYTPKEIEVKDQKVIDVILSEDLQQLEEVVVVGYGVQKKSHLTGAIAKVNTEGIEDIPVSRIDQAIQGKVAGVQIRNISSEVGSSPEIRVRGMGSLSADAEPLVIVDGFPQENGLGIVDVNDVESIEVLKDAASAAIYGSRAANGVIMVTTKSGSSSKPKYSVKLSYGTKTAYELHPIMNAGEYVALRIEEMQRMGAAKMDNLDFAYMVLNDMNGVTNWQEMPLRTAEILTAQFGIQGGKNDVNYYISGAYTGDQGIMVNNDMSRFNVRAKIDARLSKKVKIGVNLAPTITHRTSPGTNFQDYYKTPSWMPVKHNEVTSAFTGMPVGEYITGEDFNNKDYTGIDPISGEELTVRNSPYGTTNPNPQSRMDNIFRDRQEHRFHASGYLDVEIFKGLIFKTSNGATYNHSDVDSYQNVGAAKKGETNKGSYQSSMNLNLLSENTLNYSFKIGTQHSFNAMLGFSAQKISYSSAGISGQDFPSDYIRTMNAAGTILLSDDNGNRLTGTWKSEEAMASLFSRLSYNYDEKYLLSATFRTDGSSKFGKDRRWGNFPSVSVGWRVSEEPFVKNNVSWLNQFKLRGSYGITGTDKIDNYVNTNTIDVVYYPLGSGSGTVVSGLASASSSMGNVALQWEQTNEYNAGVDISVLGSRIGLSLDYYYSITKSLLFERDVNSISGFTKAWTNLGKVRNKGLEVELTTYNIRSKTFEWVTSYNFATNSNRLIDLGGPSELITTIDKKMYIARVGDPAIQYYGFKTVGVWKTLEEINNNPHHLSDVRAGGLRVWNANGDGEIDDQDRVALGSPFPDFTWGFENKFKLSWGVDITILLQGSQGGKVWNNDETINETRRWNKNYVTGRWLDEANPGDGKTPYYNYGIDHAVTDYPIQDASYISLRDVTIGYRLPKKWLKQLKLLSSLRLYASAQNLWYWWPSGYKGVNPEAMYKSGGYASPLVSGYQQGGFPIQRTVNFGIDINF
jgi:TonB-linked SusC/RagA family outer membrane protein